MWPAAVYSVCLVVRPVCGAQGVGPGHGAPPGGDGEAADGARGPAAGRSGAEAGEDAARRPGAGRPERSGLPGTL